MSFWSRMMRFLDGVLGESPPSTPDVDLVKVEQAIRLIQSYIDAERRERNVALLRVSDLRPETQRRLHQELRELLGTEPPPVLRIDDEGKTPST
jgi:hypothetical protein